MLLVLGCGGSESAELSEGTSAKAERRTPAIQFTEADILAVEDLLEWEFNEYWGDSVACPDATPRVNITSLPSTDDGLTCLHADVYSRCAGSIEWELHQVCIVCCDVDDNGVIDTDSYWTEYCDM